jgi:hypothetical protein
MDKRIWAGQTRPGPETAGSISILWSVPSAAENTARMAPISFIEDVLARAAKKGRNFEPRKSPLLKIRGNKKNRKAFGGLSYVGAAEESKANQDCSNKDILKDKRDDTKKALSVDRASQCCQVVLLT